jgi:hypothetical protein
MRTNFLAAGVSGLLVIFSVTASFAQLLNINTTAGPGEPLNNPMGVAADVAGNLFVANADDNDVLKISPNGTVTVFAGFPGVAGSADGNGTNALFNAPQGLAVDRSGTVFVADSGNFTIRQITGDGAVSTFAGSPGNAGVADGTGTNAQFFSPQGIAVDAAGTLYVADTFNYSLRKITSAGTVTTLAGLPGFSGNADGIGNKARFNRPTGLALDTNGNLFVTDLFNHTVRLVTPAGIVGTVAGLPGVWGHADGTNSGARFFLPSGIAFDGTNFFIADAGNHSIRKLSPLGTNWFVSTVAGWPENAGSANGSGIAARFLYPAGLALDTNGIIFVADAGNDLIRAGSLITNDPPVLLSQPASQSVNAGSNVTFDVSAAGSAMLFYQWQFDGEDIPGASDSSFTVINAQAADAGNYSVIVRSPTGDVASSNAVLTVYAPPVITNQPASQACLQGATVMFGISAGPPPLTYQWQKNGLPLANSATVNGATSATLTLNNVTTADSAVYSVLLNNGFGSIASSPATLNVFAVPPADAVQPTAWWQLNEGAGTMAFDYSGNGHDGTLNTGTTWTTDGHAGNGVYFDATAAAKIVLNNTFSLTGNWTAMMWVKRWGAKDSSVMLGGSHEALKLEQHSQTNHVGFTYYSHADYALNYTTPLNVWTHLAFVKTSAGISLYANGAAVATNTSVMNLEAVTLGLGYPTVTTDNLDATLNDVRIYNQALTAPQIANVYAYGRVSPIPTITLTAPTNGATYMVATNISLVANVIANNQNLVRVEFYAGANLIGQAAVPPYAVTWTNAPAGNYLLTARAVFNGTNTVDSAPVGIVIAPATNLIPLAFTANAGTLQLSWPADHTGWRLQSQTNAPGNGLSTNWVNVAGAAITNQWTIPIGATDGSVFYRLIYP